MWHVGLFNIFLFCRNDVLPGSYAPLSGFSVVRYTSKLGVNKEERAFWGFRMCGENEQLLGK